jgi:hypothetical protein
MWSFMGQSGPATAVLDFTNDFSVLFIGLVSIVGLSAAMIVWVAICHYLSQKHERLAKMPFRDANQRDAA